MTVTSYPVTPKPKWIKYPRHIGWCIRRLVQDEITIETDQGLLTMSSRDSGVAAYLYRSRQYEFNFSLDAVRLLKQEKLIPANGGTLLDIGANIGMIAIGLLRTNQVRYAIAIEPEPQNFRLLQKNISQNGLGDRISAFQVAAGESAQTLKLSTSDANHGDHRVINEHAKRNESVGAGRQVVEVKVEPLTTILQDPLLQEKTVPDPSFIWMDVQGYEGYVFKGARTLLTAGFPAVIEVWPAGILNAGMSLESFAEILQEHWTHYWLKTVTEYKKMPITEINGLLGPLYEVNLRGGKSFTKFENIILTR